MNSFELNFVFTHARTHPRIRRNIIYLKTERIDFNVFPNHKKKLLKYTHQHFHIPSNTITETVSGLTFTSSHV